MEPVVASTPTGGPETCPFPPQAPTYAERRAARHQARQLDVAMRAAAAWSTLLAHLGLDTARGRGANGGTTRLEPGQQWRRHQGAREKARRLRQGFNRWMALQPGNLYAQGTHDRLLEIAAARFGDRAELAERVVHAAALAAMAQPDPVAAMNQLLNEWEKQPDVAPAWR